MSKEGKPRGTYQNVTTKIACAAGGIDTVAGGDPFGFAQERLCTQ